MAQTASDFSLEDQISEWRHYLHRRQAIAQTDASELEDHLREQLDALTGVGLSLDEAFLVAIRRMGSQDDIAGEFAREHCERLWRQMVAAPAEGEAPAKARRSLMVALGLAVLAAAAVKIPALFGFALDAPVGGGLSPFGQPTHEAPEVYLRNAAFFVLPLLTLYFVWRRGLRGPMLVVLAGGFMAAGALANAYPLKPFGDTAVLLALHLPIALWLLVGLAYVNGRWREGGPRMDFIRFSGELVIYYALIGLGGAVLVGFTVAMFSALGINPETLVSNWLLPCGAVGAALVGAWLVEAKQSVIENMAPVLTRVFTPLFSLLMLIFLTTMAVSGRGLNMDRGVLISFDLLLVVVLGLLLYAISARDSETPKGPFDALQLGLVISAVIADAVALAAVVQRIGALGSTPNRLAALGLNLLLLVNLVWSAWLQARFLSGKTSFAALERWQIAYLPLFALWAAIVAAVFPPMFGFR